MLAACEANLITARARKNKRTARSDPDSINLLVNSTKSLKMILKKWILAQGAKQIFREAANNKMFLIYYLIFSISPSSLRGNTIAKIFNCLVSRQLSTPISLSSAPELLIEQNRKKFFNAALIKIKLYKKQGS